MSFESQPTENEGLGPMPPRHLGDILAYAETGEQSADLRLFDLSPEELAGIAEQFQGAHTLPPQRELSRGPAGSLRTYLGRMCVEACRAGLIAGQIAKDELLTGNGKDPYTNSLFGLHMSRAIRAGRMAATRGGYAVASALRPRTLVDQHQVLEHFLASERGQRLRNEGAQPNDIVDSLLAMTFRQGLDQQAPEAKLIASELSGIVLPLRSRDERAEVRWHTMGILGSARRMSPVKYLVWLNTRESRHSA